MIKVTRWHPDTCGCVVEYIWDSETDENNRIHEFKQVVEKCEFHAHLSDEETYNTVHEENPRKNKAIGKVVENHPELDQKEIEWSFDDKRQLHLAVKSLSTNRKKDLQDTLDLEHGKDKVKVH